MSEQTLLGGLAFPAGPETGAGGREAWHGAPDTYDDFILPEGCPVDPELLGQFHERARAMNLSQRAAQSLVDVHLRALEAMVRAQSDSVARQREAWIEAVHADPEIGGPRHAETLAFAAEALHRFGTPDLKAVLDATGIGNHPEVVRFFVRAGRAMSEGRFIPGARREPRSAAQFLYPNLK